MTLLPFGKEIMSDDVLRMKTRLAPGGACPVIIFDIPKLIQKEIGLWVKESRKFKDGPFPELKAHENVGYLDLDGKKHNTYQCSISPRLIEESYWLPWVLRLASRYWGTGNHRHYKIRSWSGHFDGYDIWTNFAYKGDDNPPHTHAGALSGVIYYKNHKHPTLFDEYGVGYAGMDGTMIMFPSDTKHHVETQIEGKERITLGFNLLQADVNTPNEVF